MSTTIRSNFSASLLAMASRGERLKMARKAAGFKSARAAALELDVKVGTYNTHEHAGEPGGRDFDPVYTERYIRRFKVSAEWLLTGKGQGPSKAVPTASDPVPEPASVEERLSGGFPFEPHEAPKMLETLTPVYGLAVGGDDGRFYFNGETVGWVKTPEYLRGVKNVYALYVAEESMVPRFKPGEQVWVNPHKTPIRGDDVIVQLHPERAGDNPEAYVKEFRGWTPNRLMLWQWNPAEDIEINRHLVKSIHVVVGRGPG